MATFNKVTKTWEGPKVPYGFARDSSIGAEVLKTLAETPKRVLQICADDGIHLTCEETRITAIRVAQNLTTLGYKAGDVFGFICQNGSTLPPLLYGSLLIGAAINPLDAGFKKDDIKQMFAQTKPRLVFCDAGVFNTAKQALEEIDNDAKIITLHAKIQNITFAGDLFTPTGSEGTFEAPHLGDAANVLAVILCSSGITGTSKGVCLSHADILTYIKMFDQPQPFRLLSFSPIYWSTGLFATILIAFRQQDTRIVTAQAFSVELLVKLIKKFDVNYFQAAPYQLTLLVQSPMLDPRDFVGVRVFCVLGSIISENLRKEFRDVFPRHPLIIAYGMSEFCASISATEPTERIDGLTVGRISPNFAVKVINKQGEALDIGGTGEILVKSEFPFMGYYNNPEASKAAVNEDGYLMTGDIGYIDEHGCIFIIDRKKKIMKYKGYQVNPSEIENVIESIEGVELVSVVGIPDPVCTNLPAAVIVKRPEFEDLSEQFIVDYVAEKLPEHKQLHGGAYFVDVLPMTASGKIQTRFVKVIAIGAYNEQLALENDD